MQLDFRVLQPGLHFLLYNMTHVVHAMTTQEPAPIGHLLRVLYQAPQATAQPALTHTREASGGGGLDLLMWGPLPRGSSDPDGCHRARK